MARLIKAAMGLGRLNEIEGQRMAGQEGQSNLAQATERPKGRPFNPGVSKATDPRKSRKGRYR